MKDLASTGLMAERASRIHTAFDSSWATLGIEETGSWDKDSSSLIDDLSDTLKVLANELRNIVPESRAGETESVNAAPRSVRTSLQ